MLDVYFGDIVWLGSSVHSVRYQKIRPPEGLYNLLFLSSLRRLHLTNQTNIQTEQIFCIDITHSTSCCSCQNKHDDSQRYLHKLSCAPPLLPDTHAAATHPIRNRRLPARPPHSRVELCPHYHGKYHQSRRCRHHDSLNGGGEGVSICARGHKNRAQRSGDRWSWQNMKKVC
jgi:hypothetical protein